MKYDKKAIMKKAWEIKNENKMNDFGLCLKMAWELVKETKTEKTTAEKVASLVKMGFNRWTKGNMDRLYINASELGLACTYYKTGNIHSATFDGQIVSNCEARRLKASKTYIDINTWTVYSDNNMLKDAATAMMARA